MDLKPSADEASAAQKNGDCPRCEEYLNGWKRAKADLINFQKQAEKEKTEWIVFANANLIKMLLPVVDSLKAAIGMENEEWRMKNDGFEKIYQQFVAVLKDMGVEEINGMGAPPNPEFHEVVGKEKSEDHAPGLVIKEVQKGYLLHGRVLRPAKVIVSE